MKTNIRHRRLYAFFTSKLLSSLSIFISVMLPLLKSIGWSIPVLSSIAVAFILMIAYTCWFWIKKPAVVTINRWLSNTSGYFAIYMLIAVAVETDNFLWATIPLVAAVVTLFISAIKKSDEEFTI